MCLNVTQVLQCDQSALPCCFPSIHCLAWSAGRRHTKDILHVLLEQHHQGPIPRIKWTRSPCQETLSYMQAAGGLSEFPWQWESWGWSA